MNAVLLDPNKLLYNTGKRFDLLRKSRTFLMSQSPSNTDKLKNNNNINNNIRFRL